MKHKFRAFARNTSVHIQRPAELIRSSSACCKVVNACLDCNAAPLKNINAVFPSPVSTVQTPLQFIA